MKWVLCLLVGHQKTRMAFSSTRFTCRRRGADPGRDVSVLTPPSPATRTHPQPRAADSLRRFRQEHSLADRPAARGLPRRQIRAVMTQPAEPPWSVGAVDASQAPSRTDADRRRAT
jgi:hypothetical protein